MHEHFEHKYTNHGASRLPVLAIFSIYKCLLPEIKRFDKTELKKLWSHTSPDSNSGAIGDIEVIDSKGKLFEAVEVKAGRRIDADIIGDAYDKFKSSNVKRYYFLSTLKPQESEIPKMVKKIQDIEKEHGCQVIVNGIFETIKYYLRLLENPNVFVKYYSEAMVTDDAIKREHLEVWEKLISK